MSERAGFFQVLMARPDRPSLLARYTTWNGVLYGVSGLGLLALPASVLSLTNGLPADEQGMVRLVGMAVAIIGWFYFMGGRTGAASFALATVVDRALVPVVLGILVVTGQVGLQVVAPFMVLDPILALGAFVIWWREGS